MTFFKRFSNRCYTALTLRAAICAHQHLVLLDSDTLSKAGISSELLAQGPALYPWRIDVDLAELPVCNDKELLDRGIARTEIKEAAQSGRQGGEYNETHQQAAA